MQYLHQTTKQHNELLYKRSKHKVPFMNNNWNNHEIQLNNRVINNNHRYKYMITKRIGCGTFGDIFQCKEKKERRYAIKMIKHRREWDINQRRKYEMAFIAEGRRILNLNNICTDIDEIGKRSIIKCRELLYCSADNNPILNSIGSPLMGPCIVMELCSFSLSQYIKFNESESLSLSTIRCISIQIFNAMSFIHGIGKCIHSDLKPENILIDYSDCYTSKNPKIKIADFGNAISVNKKINSFNIQSLWYRSPELLLGNYNEISSLIDMWSIGCILFELINCNRLFTSHKHNYNSAHILTQICVRLSIFPQYVYNIYKSYLYKSLSVSITCDENDSESSYIKLKNQRINQLFKLTETDQKNTKDFIDFIDLLSCLLDLNPLTRYTSEDALKHKFSGKKQKNHPIIKSSDDNQRQNRINAQICEHLSNSLPATAIATVKQHLY